MTKFVIVYLLCCFHCLLFPNTLQTQMILHLAWPRIYIIICLKHRSHNLIIACYTKSRKKGSHRLHSSVISSSHKIQGDHIVRTQHSNTVSKRACVDRRWLDCRLCTDRADIFVRMRSRLTDLLSSVVLLVLWLLWIKNRVRWSVEIDAVAAPSAVGCFAARDLQKKMFTTKQYLLLW